MHDVAIVGAGPAGLTCAMYTARYGLKTVVFDDPTNPSQLSLAPYIENYPGFEGTGLELLESMKKQARKFGVEIKVERVMDVSKGEFFKIKTDEHEYSSRSLVIATGGKHRSLGVKGEREFLGRGVSYCAVCDGFFFKGKKVLVVGGGNTALSEALYLHDLGCKVTIVHRRDEFRADRILQDRVFDRGIDVIWNAVVLKIDGRDRVESVTLRNVKTNETFTIDVEGVFVAIGIEPNVDLAIKLGVELEDGYVKVDEFCRTNVDGVFACGDCCNRPLKQVVTACGDGAIAGHSVFVYLQKEGMKRDKTV